MIIEIPECWLIHKFWSGDSSANIILFTKEFGLVKCFFKGVRAGKNKAFLQSLQPLWAAISHKRDFYFLNKLELLNILNFSEKNNLLAALYINELIYNVLKLNDPHPNLFNIYQQTIYSLNAGKNKYEIEKILRIFERALLSECGYHLAFDFEAKTNKKIFADHCYQFIPNEGFVHNDQGFLGEHLINIANNQLEDLQVLYTAKKIMRLALNEVLEGKEIMTRRLYSKNSKKEKITP